MAELRRLQHFETLIADVELLPAVEACQPVAYDNTGSL